MSRALCPGKNCDRVRFAVHDGGRDVTSEAPNRRIAVACRAVLGDVRERARALNRLPAPRPRGLFAGERGDLRFSVWGRCTSMRPLYRASRGSQVSWTARERENGGSTVLTPAVAHWRRDRTWRATFRATWRSPRAASGGEQTKTDESRRKRQLVEPARVHGNIVETPNIFRGVSKDSHSLRQQKLRSVPQ